MDFGIVPSGRTYVTTYCAVRHFARFVMIESSADGSRAVVRTPPVTFVRWFSAVSRLGAVRPCVPCIETDQTDAPALNTSSMTVVGWTVLASLDAKSRVTIARRGLGLSMSPRAALIRT